jgi:hypothetical protein
MALRQGMEHPSDTKYNAHGLEPMPLHLQRRPICSRLPSWTLLLLEAVGIGKRGAALDRQGLVGARLEQEGAGKATGTLLTTLHPSTKACRVS